MFGWSTFTFILFKLHKIKRFLILKNYEKFRLSAPPCWIIAGFLCKRRIVLCIWSVLIKANFVHVEAWTFSWILSVWERNSFTAVIILLWATIQLTHSSDCVYSRKNLILCGPNWMSLCTGICPGTSLVSLLHAHITKRCH